MIDCLPLLEVPLAEDPELLEELSSIGKYAAEEATEIAAEEGQEHAAGDAQEPPKEAGTTRENPIHRILSAARLKKERCC